MISQINIARGEIVMFDFIQQFVDFIKGIIAKIKGLVAEIRSYNDEH